MPEYELHDVNGFDDGVIVDVLDDSAPVKDRFGFKLEEIPHIARDLVQKVADVEIDGKVLRQKWIKWRNHIEAVPRPRDKNSPLVNASSVNPPLTQVHCQGMAANVIDYFSADPFWNAKNLQQDDDSYNKAVFLTRYLAMLAQSPSDLDLPSKLRIIGTEVANLGRCVVKIPYTVLQHRYRKNTTDSTDVSESAGVVTVTVHDGPELVPIPQEDIYYPKEWSDVQQMPWIGHLIRLPEHELMARKADGTWDADAVDMVLKNEMTTTTMEQRAADIIAGRSNMPRKGVYEIIEFYFYYDADGDGYVEDHIWTIGRHSGAVLRKEYNTLGQRPFEIFLFHERPYEKTGRGVAQICEPLQDELEGMHNVRNDNMKIANMRMFEMKRSHAMANGEELYPGKIWLTDTPGSIRPIQLGDVYPSTMQDIQYEWQIAAQATGLSEVQRGFADPTLGQRDTFRGQQMRMNASRGIFGVIADGMARSFNRVGMLVLHQLIINAPRVIARENELQRLSQDEMQMLQALLTTDIESAPAKFAFYVKTGDIDAQQGAIIQMIQQVTQMYSVWAQQSTPLAMQLFGPQGQQLKTAAPDAYDHMLAVYVGSTRLLERLMKVSGIQDADNYVPQTAQFEVLLKALEAVSEQQARSMENGTGIQRRADGSYGPPQAGQGGMAGGMPGNAQSPGSPGVGMPPAVSGGSAGSMQGPAGGGSGTGGYLPQPGGSQGIAGPAQ